MTIDSHVTLPSDVTMTFVLMEDLYADTSALRTHTRAGDNVLTLVTQMHRLQIHSTYFVRCAAKSKK